MIENSVLKKVYNIIYSTNSIESIFNLLEIPQCDSVRIFFNISIKQHNVLDYSNAMQGIPLCYFIDKQTKDIYLKTSARNDYNENLYYHIKSVYKHDINVMIPFVKQIVSKMSETYIRKY